MVPPNRKEAVSLSTGYLDRAGGSETFLSGASSDPNVVTLSPGYLRRENCCWSPSDTYFTVWIPCRPGTSAGREREGGGEGAFVGKCFASRINCDRLKWLKEVGGYMRDMEKRPGVAKLTKAPGGGDLRASQSGSGGYHRQGFTGALGQCREGAGEGCRRGGGGRREEGGGRRRRGERGRVGVRGEATPAGKQQPGTSTVDVRKQAGAKASKQVVPRRIESITPPLPC